MREFQAIDINSDNQISREEFVNYLRNRNTGGDLDFAESLANKMFNAIDRDGNGYIDM